MKQYYKLLICIILNCCVLASVNAQSQNYSIEINIPAKRLYLVDENRNVIKEYSVGLGKSAYFATPEGNHRIISKTKNPGWVSPTTGRKIQPGERNPLGTRWLGFFRDSKGLEYGMHGSHKVNSIGRLTSHGCVRMHIKDSEELFDLVEMHTPVNVVYERAVLSMGYDNDLILTVHPDVYHKQRLSVESLIAEIKSEYPHMEFINNRTIEMMLSNINKHRLPLTRVIGY